MIKKIILFFIIISVILSSQTVYATSVEKTTDAPGELQKLYARSACLMDADSERVLFEKNGNQEMPMASTTKIMTCIVILEHAKLNDIVTVSKHAAKMPDVQLNIKEGEQFKVGDLLYSLMLESHNDTAVALAEHVGGSVEGFAKMMDAKAHELGCEHTSFVTPNGLDAQGHFTTAVELAKIASYAIRNPEFVKITNTPTYTFSEVNGKRKFTVNNKNAFLHLMGGAMGVKTGFTGKAGYCFVGALKKDGKTFVSVVLACGWPNNKSYKWADTKKLMNYGLHNYEMKDISEGIKVVKKIPVLNGQDAFVPVKYQQDSLKLLLNKNETSNIKYSIPDAVKAPIYKDEVIGNISYYINDHLYKKTPIYAAVSVKRINYWYWLNRICSRWLLQ